MRARRLSLLVLGLAVAGLFACGVTVAPEDDEGAGGSGGGAGGSGGGAGGSGGSAGGSGGGAGGSGGGAGGSGGGGPSCDASFDDADACGGDLSGTWRYVASCTSEDALAIAFASVCPGVTSSDTVLSSSGRLSVSDGAYDLQVNTLITGTAMVPALCAAQAGGCPGVERALPTLIPGASGSCAAADGGACSCEVTVPLASESAGTIVTAGGRATLDSGEQYRYCVDGSTLRYAPVEGTGAEDEGLSYLLTR